MNHFPTGMLHERNPITNHIHRKEVFWQIALPLGIGVLLVLALAVTFSFGGNTNVNRWAQISIIWLALPLIIFLILFLVILAGLIYAATWILRVLPPYSNLANNFISRVGSQLRKGADITIEPILRLSSWRAGARTLRRR